MQEHLGKILVGGLFLALLAGRIYFKKPSFVPEESCWHCLWCNLTERIQTRWPEFKWLHALEYTAVGFVLGSWAVLFLQRLWVYLLGRQLIHFFT